MRYLACMAAVAGAFFLVSCAEDDCYYCGKDISGGVSVADADRPVVPKESEQPDEEKADIGYPDEELDGEDTDHDIVLEENMVLIGETTFMMGCEENVSPACTEANALPQHEVTVPSFEIDVYEVTKKEYKACIDAKGCENDIDNGVVLYQTVADSPFCVLDSSLGDPYPVNCVSWAGARAYCAWQGKRLPTEAEWELAARGDDGRAYPWGNAPGASCDNTVMDGASDWGCDGGLSLPVGSRPSGKSPYGLYDMAGNMWEWVEDDWHENYDDPARPDDGSAWVDTVRPANRVIRGGSFMTDADEFFMFTTYGRYGSPADDTYISRGFRCAR